MKEIIKKELKEEYQHRLRELGADHLDTQVFKCLYELYCATEKEITDKACEWLNANWRKYIDADRDGMIRFSGWMKDFKKAMTE